MKFTKESNFLNTRLSSLKRFNTNQEKNSLLVEDSEPDSHVVAELTNLKPINEIEAGIFLLKLREISVSDILEVIVTCPKCEIMNDFHIEIKDLLNLEKQYKLDTGEKLPIGVFNGIEDIMDEDELENITLKKCNEIESVIKEQNENIIQTAKVSCRKCQHSMSLEISPRIHYTKSTPASIYQEYVDISTFTNNGTLDIDSLFPFEREIYISLIKERMKED